MNLVCVSLRHRVRPAQVRLGLQEGSIACVRRQIGVRDLFNKGISASEIARRLKIGRASVCRVLEL
jgi:DNA invertase Pin-like site-specific DNA recombinase